METSPLNWLEDLQISKFASSLISLFIPSIDQALQTIDQAKWQNAALEMFGTFFGGATAFPKGKGVWRDDRRGGLLIYDDTIVVQCFTVLEKIQNTARF